MQQEEKIIITEFFENQEVTSSLGRCKVKIAKKPMTQEQARRAYPYRPHSKYAESRWGGNTLYDDVCLVINGLAVRCKMCQTPTRKKYLEDGVCPDCDGRAEYNGHNPHQS